MPAMGPALRLNTVGTNEMGFLQVHDDEGEFHLTKVWLTKGMLTHIWRLIRQHTDPDQLVIYSARSNYGYFGNLTVCSKAAWKALLVDIDLCTVTTWPCLSGGHERRGQGVVLKHKIKNTLPVRFYMHIYDWKKGR